MPSGLRFDRVAREFVGRLRDALSPSVPKGHTLLFTVTAPIRQDSKTRAEFERALRTHLGGRPKKAPLLLELHGNALQAQLLDRAGDGGPNVIGFVHNRAIAPGLLFETARVVLAARESRSGP